MSVNQSRGDKNEVPQYRRSGQSSNPAPQRNFSGGGGGAGAGSGAGNTTVKSFKKVVGNAQGGHVRVSGSNPNVNLDPLSSSSGGRTVQNGAHIQPPLKGPDAPFTGANVKPTDASIQKSTPGLPKAPPGNAVTSGSAATGPTTPAKDASRAFPLQFGSISPGVMNGMQVPARTNSAPPNMDEQKRAQQARLDSLKATSFQNPAVSKDPGPANQSNPGQPHPIPKEKKGGPVSAAPAPAPAPTHPQKPPGPPMPPIPGVSMQMPFHQSQLHFPYGGPMHLPVGNPPQQPVFVPGIQHHQGMIHQMGHPQLGNIGIGLGPQYPQHQQQHIGNFGGTGTRRAVKITHPDTHEELKLDKRTEGFPNSASAGLRSHPHVPTQSQPVPSFPINYYSNSYNSSPVFFSTSNAGSQAPRSNNQVTVKPVVSSPAMDKKAGGEGAATAAHPRKDSETITGSSLPVQSENLTDKKVMPATVTIDGINEPGLKSDNSDKDFNSTEMIGSGMGSTSDVKEPKAEITGSKERGEDGVDQNAVNDNIDVTLSKSVLTPELNIDNCETPVMDSGSDDRLISSENIDSGESVTLDQESPAVSVSVSVPEATPSLEVNDSVDLISPSSSGSIDKTMLETVKGKGNISKRKKNIKEMLKNADAQGTTSDLYVAYKRPKEKKETLSTETVDVVSGITPKQETVDSSEKDEKADLRKSEPDDWEDVVDVSTPELKTLDNGNDGTTKKYSRDFLLKFMDHHKNLPEGFKITSDIAEALTGSNVRESYPSPGRGGDDKWNKAQGSMGPAGRGHVVVRNPRGQIPGQYDCGILSRPIPSPGAQRNNSDSDRWQRGTGYQKGLIPSPHTPVPVMHKAEKKYEIGKITDEEQAKQRQLKGILNKLTPQNFEKLFEQVKQVNIDNAATLSGVIGQIFDKALMEPTFVEMYANFCSQLAMELPDFSDDNQKINFKRSLLNKCQEEFERGEQEQEEANRAEEEGEVKQTEGEREEKRVKARRRMLGNIRLIGELYKKKMLTERIMHECIMKLLGQYENPDEENIESLCKLMSTIGDMIDHPKAKEHMDVYFDMMFKLSNNMELSSRVRFMLKDVIDLRKNKWHQRRKVDGPKKIEEVHRDAAQERQAQSSRLARGSNPNVRRVQVTQPVDFGPRGSNVSPSPMGGFRGMPPQQLRGYGNQDARFEERHSALSVPLRPIGDESITLGPQGGLARGMSVRGPPLMGGPNGYGSIPERVGYGPRDDLASRYVPERFDRVQPSSPPPRAWVPTPPQSGSSDKILDEDHLRDKSIQAIKEFYSARDEKEVSLCIKELNTPSFYPSMISIWVTDSFERKDMERDSLAKLLISLAKSQDGILSQDSLLGGLESVLSTLEDAVNDAPKAAEFLGGMMARILLEGVIPYKEMWRLIYQGGEEQGRLVQIGLAADLLGVILEIIKSEKGDPFLKDLRDGFNPRLEEYRPASIKKSLRLDKFI